jgi:23S rRNA pseudouridine1911/1915/1917 synthase
VGRNPRFRNEFTTFPEGDQGRWAVTHYEVLERLYYVSLIKCNLETGRTHQIRVHLAAMGHPLIGDRTYGAGFLTKTAILPLPARTLAADFPRQALHAFLLGFEHPASGEELLFESDPPAEFAHLQDTLAAL